MRRFLLSLMVAVSLFVPAASVSAQVVGCSFQLGFATLAAMIPVKVGACLENENHNPRNGDGLQHTTNGLMAWRKADNWTAFTNGYWTWINGPSGLAKRLNTQRFSWEANPDGLPLVTEHTFYASTYHPLQSEPFSAKYIYCDTDSDWQKLSTTYLAHYANLAAAEAALPGYVLHKPC